MEQTISKLLKNEFLVLVSRLAAGMGVKAYFVGGGLRDSLAGREMKDFDFVLGGAPEELPVAFARDIGGTFFWLDQQRLQSRVVRRNGGESQTFDFAPQRGDDIVQDMLLRDFSINALALPLEGGQSSVIDPCGGLSDLRKGVIRACSDHSFDNDPLRLLRALRFSTVLGFSIEPGTWGQLREKASLLRGVAPERIREELFLMLETADAGNALGRLHETGLLDEILPSAILSGRKPVEQRRNRVLEVGHAMAEVVRDYSGARDQVLAYLGREVESGVTTRSLLKLAAFLRDGEAPSAVADTAAERLKLGCKARRILEILCGENYRLLSAPGWEPTKRAAYRFFKDREPAGPAALVIAVSRGLLRAELCFRMIRYYFDEYPTVSEENLLSGEEIMELLGIGPGKRVGEAVERLKDAERAGLVNDREEARAFLVKNLLTKDEPVI